MTKNRPQDRQRPNAEPAAAPARPPSSLGAWLRTQREARGVSLRDIADASKIGLRYLEALEHDRFDVLPAPVFTRGFLREYARVVGLDPDEVVNLYLLAAEEDEATATDLEARPERSRPRLSPLGFGLVLLGAAVVLAAIGLLVAWLVRGGGRPVSALAAPADVRPAARAEATAAEPEPPPAPARAPEPADPPDLAQSDAPASPPAATASGTRPPAPAASPAVPPAVTRELGDDPAAPAVAAAVPAAPLRVVLEFTRDCWMEVVLDGKRRTSELRTSGEVITLTAESSVLLTLGDTEAARVEVDGRPLTIPAGAGRVIRDLRIDRELAARLAAGPAPVP